MPENDEPTIEDLRVRTRDIKLSSVLLGLLSHYFVFQRFTQIRDERVFDFILYQFIIFIMQIVLFISLATLVDYLYRVGEEKLALIFSYAILGMAVLAPIVYIVSLNPK